MLLPRGRQPSGELWSATRLVLPCGWSRLHEHGRCWIIGLEMAFLREWLANRRLQSATFKSLARRKSGDTCFSNKTTPRNRSERSYGRICAEAQPSRPWGRVDESAGRDGRRENPRENGCRAGIRSTIGRVRAANLYIVKTNARRCPVSRHSLGLHTEVHLSTWSDVQAKGITSPQHLQTGL